MLVGLLIHLGILDFALQEIQPVTINSETITIAFLQIFILLSCLSSYLNSDKQSCSKNTQRQNK